MYGAKLIVEGGTRKPCSSLHYFLLERHLYQLIRDNIIQTHIAVQHRQENNFGDDNDDGECYAPSARLAGSTTCPAPLCDGHAAHDKGHNFPYEEEGGIGIERTLVSGKRMVCQHSHVRANSDATK